MFAKSFRQRIALIIAPELRCVSAGSNSLVRPAFDVEAATSLLWKRSSWLEAEKSLISRAVKADASALEDDQGLSHASRPLECGQTQEETEAWLATASGEELRATAARLSADQLSPAEAALQQRISLALCASAKLWSRWIDEVEANQSKRHLFRAQGSAQGNRT